MYSLCVLTFFILIRWRKSGSSPPVVSSICLVGLSVVDFNEPVSVVSAYDGTTGAFDGQDWVRLIFVVRVVVGLQLVSVVRSLGQRLGCRRVVVLVGDQALSCVEVR